MQIHHYIRIFTVQVCIFHTCINFILQRNQAVGCLIRKSWPVSKIPAQVLTLINGDRISMPPMVRLLFEVADLAQASPATVSRAGMATKQHWWEWWELGVIQIDIIVWLFGPPNLNVFWVDLSRTIWEVVGMLLSPQRLFFVRQSATTVSVLKRI